MTGPPPRGAPHGDQHGASTRAEWGVTRCGAWPSRGPKGARPVRRGVNAGEGHPPRAGTALFGYIQVALGEPSSDAKWGARAGNSRQQGRACARAPGPRDRERPKGTR